MLCGLLGAGGRGRRGGRVSKGRALGSCPATVLLRWANGTNPRDQVLLMLVSGLGDAGSRQQQQSQPNQSQQQPKVRRRVNRSAARSPAAGAESPGSCDPLRAPRIDSYRFSMANLEDSQDVDLDAILGELCALESQYDQAIARQDEDLPIIPTNRGPQNHTSNSCDLSLQPQSQYQGNTNGILTRPPIVHRKKSLESLGRAQQGAPGGVGMGRQNSQHHHTHSRSSSDGTRMRSENSQEMEGLSRSDAGVARTDSPDNDSAFSDNLSMLSSESSASSGGSGGGGRVVDVISSSSSSSSGHKPRTSGGIMPQSDGLIDRRSHGLVGDDVDEASRAKAEKIRLALDKMREASVRKLFIKAFSSDGSAKSLLVDERMGAGQVARLLADKNHVRMEPKWALVEYLPHLHMERVYEDHEPLVENLMMWTNDSKNQIQFVERPDKYLRLFSHPEEFLLPQASSDHGREFDDDSRAALIEEFFSGNGGAPCVPDMEGPLWLKAESKKGWKRYHFVLRASGLYYWPKEKSSSSSLTHRPPSHQLVCLATFDVNEAYWGLGWKKKYKAPTEYCFAIKHPRLQQPKSTKYIKFLCAEDGPTLARWITGIRIAKHGRRILDNYRLLVDELAQEDLDALAHARSCSISSVALGSGNVGTPSPGRTPEDDFAPSEDISGQVTLRRRNHTIEQSRASSSGSSGCGSDAGSAGSSGTGGGSCTPAFESDFPGMGTIKRKPSLQPKLPLTSMTRQLKEVGEDASVVGSTNSHDRSSSEDGTCTLTRTPSTLSRLSSRYSSRSSSSTLESRPSALRPRQQPLQRPVERSPTPEEDPENLPLPPPPEIFQSTLSLVDSVLPPPPPELLTGNATIEDDTPLPPPPADLPPLPATPPPLASCMMGTNTVRRAPRRISFGDEASRNASLSPTHNPLPPSPSSPHSPPVVPPHAPGRPVMVMPMAPVPSPPKRSDGTRLSTPPAPSTSHYAPSSLASCDPPAHEFLSDLQRVMRRKWQVAQKCKWDHTTTPHEVLGFRDPPPPVADYRETNVSNWVREHYGIPGESAVWMPADGSGGSATDPHHPRSRTSVQGGSMRKRPPPPPPKRSESTHLSTAPSRGSQ